MQVTKRHVGIAVAAIGVAAVVLLVNEWDAQRRAAPVVAAQQDLPPPPGAKPWKLATAPAPAWDANAARNAKDLYAEYERAKASSDPVAWYIAAEIAGQCFSLVFNSTYTRDPIDKERGEWNSTKAGDPQRQAKLLVLEQRQAALAELTKRCKGFEGKPADYQELRARVEASDSDFGRLLRAMSASAEGVGDAREWESAMNAAIASGNTVMTRLALYHLASRLPDEPKLSGFAALMAALDHLKGYDFDRNELDLLVICAMGGRMCEREDPSKEIPPPEWTAKDVARFKALVAQYEQALNTQDVKAILAVKPPA